MRVPISVQDLRHGHGLSRIAEVIQREWPDAGDISLADAQEALSHGLGYRDFNSLQQSVQTELACESSTTQAEARDGISTALFVCWGARHARQMDESHLHHLVMSLPLQELTAFGASSAQLASDEYNQPIQMPIPLKQQDSLLPTQASALATAGQRRTKDYSQSTNRLRDLCLFELLMMGHRACEVRMLRFRDISTFHSGTLVKFFTTKASNRQRVVVLPLRVVNLVTQYALQANLSESDFLFHSRRDASVPMRPHELNKLLVRYMQALVPALLRNQRSFFANL